MHKFSTDKAVVLLARRPSRHGSDPEQDKQPHCRAASVLEAPNAVELATGHEQLRGKAVSWTGESAQLWCATVRLGNGRAVHLLAERLGDTGWDWHVWVQAGWTWARYGLAGTAGHARKQAEQALMGLMRPDADGNAPLGPNRQFVLFPQRGAWDVGRACDGARNASARRGHAVHRSFGSDTPQPRHRTPGIAGKAAPRP